MSAFVIVLFSFLSIVELSRKEVIDVFKSVSDFDSAIKKVLKMFLDGKTSNEIRNSVDDDAYGEIIEVCCQKNYLSGITCRRTEGNTIHTNVVGDIKVTYYGLQFIEN